MANLSLAQQALVADLELGSDRKGGLSRSELAKLARHLTGYKFPLVYTAFDGDHFALTTEMRTYSINRNAIPVNPESILGYFETVNARLTKHGLLRDDLALLRRCDELWIFTDVPPSADAVGRLAEGVLVELCFYMLANGNASVSFVPITPLVLREKPDPIPFDGSVMDVFSHLNPMLRADILKYLGGMELGISKDLPGVSFAIADVLDSKYYRWLRPYSLHRNIVTVVPGLAIDISDALWGSNELGCLLVSWTHLMRLADQAWIVQPMDKHRSMGNVQQVLQRHWEISQGGPLSDLTWADLQVPKVLLGEAWPLSEHSA